MMHAYQMQRMRAADSHSSTRTPGPVVLPGMRTGAHAGRIPSRPHPLHLICMHHCAS